jgi:hypothetical protein
MKARRPSPEALIARWRGAWPQALAAWSRYTRLHDPRLCASTPEAAREGLSGSFAMILLADQSVVVDLEAVCGYGLQDYAVEILAHEIGHHVLAPGNADDHLRLLARIRRSLPGLERHAPMVANLYTDLLINDRLQRQSALRMAGIYRSLARAKPDAGANPVWAFYMRIYEHLWTLTKGELAGAALTEAIDADAWLGARVVRVYANDWLRGAGRFGTLVLPYLVDQRQDLQALGCLYDTKSAAAGCTPGAVHEIDADEAGAAMHPLDDPRVTGEEGAAAGGNDGARSADAPAQAREPFEYGEILKAAGIVLDERAVALRYYRERAQPHLIPFPVRPVGRGAEPRTAAVEPWDIGDPLDSIDWLHSLALSPRPVPGLTTVQRTYEADPGRARAPAPVDLDLYVDSSGSMPDPRRELSYPALAGAIVALSALRAGAAVQATLWSGKQQVLGTPGFVRDAEAILGVLTGFFGGGTCFPIHRLRDTYVARAAHAAPTRPAHILMISDDGITTMFERDEQGNSGWQVAASALRTAAGGGTMALNVRPDWASCPRLPPGGPWNDLVRARDEQGWDIHAVADMAQLVAFARAFSRRRYGALLVDAAGKAGRP